MTETRRSSCGQEVFRFEGDPGPLSAWRQRLTGLLARSLGPLRFSRGRTTFEALLSLEDWEPIEPLLPWNVTFVRRLARHGSEGGIRWRRGTGCLVSSCGRHRVWQTTSRDGSSTWNASSDGLTRYDLGYLVDAKRWCSRHGLETKEPR